MRASVRIAAALLASVAAPALAQTVDYTAAEQLFGEPVTTSVTGKPQRVSEVPANMEIVTAEQIRRSGADNIPDVLRFVAGLDVRRYGQLNTAVGIRGYNTALNPRVLVLLNGRQVYDDSYGMTVWALIPVALSEIRQIEIIKGPSAALYGFNAVSGVINIITVDPLHDKVNAVAGETGTQHLVHGEAVATAQIPGRLGVRLSAEGFRADEFDRGSPLAATKVPEGGNAALDARVQVAPGVEWDLSGSVGRVKSDYYIDLGTYQPFAYSANSIRSRIAADTAVGLLQLDAYRNENRTTESSALAATALVENVTVVQGSDLVKLGVNHTVRIGAEFRNNSIASAQSFSGRLTDTIAAGSVMWDWQILPQLALTNAIRVDALSLTHQGPQFTIPTLGGLYHDTSIVEPSFNSGAVYKATDYDTLRLSAARAVQLPSLVDFGLAENYGPVIVAGNPGLQPSTVTNYEVDYDRALPAIGSTVRLAIFAQNTAVTIGSPFGSGVSFLPTGQALLAARNYGDSREVGGEIGIRGSSASGLRWNASYALAAVHDDTPAALLAMAASVGYQRQTPVHSIIVGAGYTWGRLELDAQARWQSRFQDYRLNTATLSVLPFSVPNYITVDARLGYRLTDNLSVSLTAEQLNQDRIVETAGLTTERRILAGVKADF